MKIRLTIVGIILLGGLALRAQIVNDGATRTLINETNTFTGDVTVGTNGSFTLLILSSNALLTNSANSTIGLNATAKSNEVRLISATARWRMGGSAYIGNNGAFNRLAVSNGAQVASLVGAIGLSSPSASNNTVVVNGAGSVWSNVNNLVVGNFSSGNRLEVSGGGWVANGGAIIGSRSSSSNNLVLVTGVNSVWSNPNDLTVGFAGGGNQLVVSNGGLVWNNYGYIGEDPGGTVNLALVTGAGSWWSNQSDLYVGASDKGNKLVVTNSGTVTASNLFVGFLGISTNNRIVVDGGTLRVTNVAGNGTLDVRRGTNALIAGSVEVDQLLVTNAAGLFELNGGTLSAKKTTISNGQLFRVGNGVSAATFTLAGNGTHTFANGLTVSFNSVLTGNGNVGGAGIVTVSSGGTLAPGASIGKIVLSNSLVSLGGTVVMEISKNGSVLTNDQVQMVTGTLTYGGSLMVTNISIFVLAAGDRFQLFPATSYTGAFSVITLPPLRPGLNWTNKLLLDGSIEVTGVPPPAVLTLSATAVTMSSATLNGIAFPNETNASGWFEWGTTTNYGNLTPAQAFGSGTTSTNFSEVITGLTTGAVYHFRAVTSNSTAIVTGTDVSFNTATVPSDSITYIKASSAGSSDFFGFTVAISGDTVVVGAVGEDSNATGINGDQSNNSADNSGAAYVFVHSGRTWSQEAYLKASNTAAFDQFGDAVAISGDTIVVGAPFEDSNATGVNGSQTNNSATDSGAAYVFVRNGTTWTQQAYLKASNTGIGDSFGSSVAISGNTIVVGVSAEDSNATGVNGDQSNNSATDSGAAYVFVRSGTNWSQQAYLKASNTDANDLFGISVSVSGDTMVVGALFEDSNATGINGNASNNSSTNSGAAYVFVRNGTNWTQQAYLKASNTDADDRFGVSVAVSGDTVVVGAGLEDGNATGVNGDGSNNSATNSGAAYVFVRNGTNWTQQAYLKASNTDAHDDFGLRVAVSGDMVATVAGLEDSKATGINGDDGDNSSTNSGAAYVFVRRGTNWMQQAYLKASNTEAGDTFGDAVAVSANVVVVGSDQEDSNATGVNGDGSNNSLINSGAVYVFDLSAPPVLSILDAGPAQVRISWMPPTPGFALEEALSLSAVSWSNSPSGETNPITLPVTSQTKFFRLIKPSP